MPTQSSNTQWSDGDVESGSIKEIRSTSPGTNMPFGPGSCKKFLEYKFKGSKQESMKHFGLQCGISASFFSLD
jgi:hypothetical protein